MGRNRWWPKLRPHTVYARQGGGLTETKPARNVFGMTHLQTRREAGTLTLAWALPEVHSDSHLFCALIHAAAGPSIPVTLTCIGGQQLGRAFQ